jgi:NhaA family Na+:H+ antiporter
MAIFFFLVGLEIKREVLEGELSSKAQIALPAIAALGGMVTPALIFTFFNHSDSFSMNGWAIPTATDIAFALGILSLLGSRVPTSLKIFLMALAIIDDLGAIVIIALFYTNQLSLMSILVALGSIVVLVFMNQLNVLKKAAYVLVGIVLWVSVLKSGVHATIAGVVFAFCIPLYSDTKKGERFSMLKEMEHDLHYWVAFFILPLFAFVNAGVDLKDLSPLALFSDVSLGIMIGLFLGKQLGVFIFSLIAIKLGFATLPTNSNFKQLYGVAILTGIGFTMSLFVNTLAYNDTDLFHYADKLAILLGSFLSGIVGYFFLKKTSPNL